MNVSFDFYNKIEKPSLILSTPNKDYISSIGVAYDINLKLNFNDLSILTFSIPQQIDGIETNNYDLIVGKKLVLVEDAGWFKLENPKISSDGIIEIKQCTAYSLETEFRQKNITSLNGTYKFYDPIAPQDSLLGIIIDEIPSWSLGNIDSELWTKFRTFDVDEQNLYSFIMEDVAQTFECVFTFDTFNKEVNVQAIGNIGSSTSIFLSFDNLLKQVSIDENSEEIITALKVYGGNDLDIRSVNPNGTDVIYDFTYFKTTEWIGQDLIDAIDDYEVLQISLTVSYQTNLSSLKTKNVELLQLNTELTTLNSELLALEDIQKTRIQASLDYSDIYSQILSKETEINTKESQVTDKENEISAVESTLDDINNQLELSNNFTLAQIEELDTITIEDTYQDGSFIITDSMTEEEKIEVSQELYDFGAEVLSRVSQPRYTFSINSSNFIFLKEFESFTEQLELGDTITLAFREDYVIAPVLLSINYSFENDTQFELTFGNRYKLDGEFLLEDLLNSSVKSSSTLSFNNYIYSDWKDTSKDSVTTFINSALDASKNAVISAESQDVLINQNGIRLRQSDGSGGFLDEQLWLVNNMVALSSDGFENAEIGIGLINDSRYGNIWGISNSKLYKRVVKGGILC